MWKLMRIVAFVAVVSGALVFFLDLGFDAEIEALILLLIAVVSFGFAETIGVVDRSTSGVKQH